MNPSFRSARSPRLLLLAAALTLVLLGPGNSAGQVWPDVPLIQHSTFQAVNADGSHAYDQLNGFPVRLQGVVLNNNEDWLDPAANYSTTPWHMGGQAEVFVQAVEPGDFGGTAAWMGQNYGNLPWIGEPEDNNYSNVAWDLEMDRLGFWRPGSTLSESQLVRAGDLVEIQARYGLHYQGKMNVNEGHSNDEARDFEIVILQKGFGLPTPTPLTLDAFKDPNNEFIFDHTRATGGERYQAELIELVNVRFQDTDGWEPYANLTLEDPTGLTMGARLANNSVFAGHPPEFPGTYYNVTGILNQGGSTTGGYYLIITGLDAFAPVPEPGAAVLVVILCGLLPLVRLPRSTRQKVA